MESESHVHKRPKLDKIRLITLNPEISSFPTIDPKHDSRSSTIFLYSQEPLEITSEISINNSETAPDHPGATKATLTAIPRPESKHGYVLEIKTTGTLPCYIRADFESELQEVLPGETVVVPYIEEIALAKGGDECAFCVNFEGSLIHCPVITADVIEQFASPTQFAIGSKIKQTQPILHGNYFCREIIENGESIFVTVNVVLERSTFNARCTCQKSPLSSWCSHIVGLMFYFAKHRNKGIKISDADLPMNIEEESTVSIQSLIDERFQAFANNTLQPDLTEVNCLIFKKDFKNALYYLIGLHSILRTFELIKAWIFLIKSARFHSRSFDKSQLSTIDAHLASLPFYYPALYILRNSVSSNIQMSDEDTRAAQDISNYCDQIIEVIWGWPSIHEAIDSDEYEYASTLAIAQNDERLALYIAKTGSMSVNQIIETANFLTDKITAFLLYFKLLKQCKTQKLSDFILAEVLLFLRDGTPIQPLVPLLQSMIPVQFSPSHSIKTLKTICTQKIAASINSLGSKDIYKKLSDSKLIPEIRQHIMLNLIKLNCKLPSVSLTSVLIDKEDYIGAYNVCPNLPYKYILGTFLGPRYLEYIFKNNLRATMRDAQWLYTNGLTKQATILTSKALNHFSLNTHRYDENFTPKQEIEQCAIWLLDHRNISIFLFSHTVNKNDFTEPEYTELMINMQTPLLPVVKNSHQKFEKYLTNESDALTICFAQTLVRRVEDKNIVWDYCRKFNIKLKDLVPVMKNVIEVRGDSPRYYTIDFVQENIDIIYRSQLEGVDNMAFLITCYWVFDCLTDQDVIEMCLKLAEKVKEEPVFDMKLIEEACSYLAPRCNSTSQNQFAKLFNSKGLFQLELYFLTRLVNSRPYTIFAVIEQAKKLNKTQVITENLPSSSFSTKNAKIILKALEQFQLYDCAFIFAIKRLPEDQEFLNSSVRLISKASRNTVETHVNQLCNSGLKPKYEQVLAISRELGKCRFFKESIQMSMWGEKYVPCDFALMQNIVSMTPNVELHEYNKLCAWVTTMREKKERKSWFDKFF